MENLTQNILPVPLIIKVPGQREGVVSFRNAETIDIVPTLADILGREVDWEIDGVSLLGEPKPPVKRAVHHYKEMALFETNTGQVQSALMNAVRQSGMNGDSHLSEDLYRESAQFFLDRPIEHFELLDDLETQVRIRDIKAFDDVRMESAFLPAHVNGFVSTSREEPMLLAIALNGRVRSITESFSNGGRWEFSTMLPETVFKEGKNNLMIYRVETVKPGSPSLVFLGPRSDQNLERWSMDDGQLTLNGESLAVDNLGVEGGLDYISFGEESVEILGWAIDAANRRAVRSVLVFDGSALVYEGGTPMLREETHRFDIVVNVGFQVVVPTGSNKSEFRVFAVTDDGRSREIKTE